MEIICNNGTKINNICTLEVISRSINMKYWNEKNAVNGELDGNIFYAEPQNVRLDYAVLRYSCPRIAENPKYISEELILHHGQKMVICKKGSVYIIDEDEWYLESLESALLLLDINEEYKTERISM